MIGTVVTAVISALLTSVCWKFYHDKILAELFTAGWDKGSDAYQEGWDNGHLEGLEEGHLKGYSEGYEIGHREGYEAGDAPKKPAKVVKKAKKITPKGD